MNLNTIGEILRFYREKYNFKQSDVCNGICSISTLSRIENGAQKPGRLIMEKLFERLGTENNLFNSFVSREEMELYSAIQELIRNITDKDISKIESQVDVVELMTKDTTELEHQCLYFAKGELARQRDENNDKAMELYMKAIHITLPDFDGKNPLRSNLLTFDEIMIINAIAILYAESGNIMLAIQLDMWLKEYMESKIVDGTMKIAKYPMILYNLSNWFGDRNCHTEAFELANQGIDFCIKYGNLFFFPIFLVNKGIALAELGKIDDGKEYLHQAIIIFEATKQKDHVQPIIDWCKLHYDVEF